jgi:hypothetical protein
VWSTGQLLFREPWSTGHLSSDIVVVGKVSVDCTESRLQLCSLQYSSGTLMGIICFFLLQYVIIL